MSYSDRNHNPPHIDEIRIRELCKVTETRIRAIFMYGSQVYGTQTSRSDYDFLVIACTMHSHKEFNDGSYNVHIKTPDLFYDELIDHKMSALECIYAPNFAQIQVFSGYGVDLSNFKINQTKLKRRALADSHHSWFKAKRMINDGDIYRGMKSAWHSLRILMFADQILNEGCIYDFSEANNYWEEINKSNAVSWADFKGIALKKKFMLEEIIKNHQNSENDAENIVRQPIVTIKDIIHNALTIEQVQNLNDKRLLAYYKKKLKEIFRYIANGAGEEGYNTAYVDKDRISSKYLKDIKNILDQRENIN